MLCPVTSPGVVGAVPAMSVLAGHVLDTLDCHLAVIDRRGRIVAVNAAWTDFARRNGGVDVGVGADYFAVCERADDALAVEALAGIRSVADGAVGRFDLEYPCHGPDQERWFRLLAIRIEDPDGPLVVVRHDHVTAEHLALDQVRVRGDLLDAVEAGVIATDLEGRIEVWNEGARRLYGWRSEEARGRLVHELLVSPASRAAAGPAFDSMVTGDRTEWEFESVHRDGTRFPTHVNNRILRDDQGRPVGVVGVTVDISERVAKERELVRNNAWLRAVTDRMGDGLCTLGLDGRIRYANPEGVRLLGVGRAGVEGGRFTSRLLASVEDVAANLREHLIGADFEGIAVGEMTEARLLRGDGTTVPIEYVATVLPEDEQGLPTGWVVVFRDITERLAQRRRLFEDSDHARWMTRIREALDHDRFVLHAQPIVDIRTGRVVQHELLVRLLDPDEGLILPGQFLPTAEAYGLAPAIDRWVIRRAIELAASGHPVEVNLSARSFADPSLPYLIGQLIAERGVDPHLLVFELTETALLENDEEAASFAARIRALGCQLALDDFGTGYGAFTYLKNLPMDLLKIDIEFVRDAVSDPASRHVIAAVVALAQAFGLRTVAEGVEDQRTLELLGELGVDQAQGYHVGAPVPVGLGSMRQPSELLDRA